MVPACPCRPRTGGAPAATRELGKHVRNERILLGFIKTTCFSLPFPPPPISSLSEERAPR